MNQRENGRQRGRAAAQAALQQNLHNVMQREFEMNLALFPSLGAGHDMAKGVLTYDQNALSCAPEIAKFPETKGLTERALGEREGFIESSGFTLVHAAYYYSWVSYIWKHINAHHVARYDLASAPQQCTNVFFPEGKDGVTVSDNRDDLVFPWYHHVPKYRHWPTPEDYRPGWKQGGASSRILLDEEPACPFPYQATEFIPEECGDDIRVLVQWMDERRDFWDAGNQIWIDRHMNAVAVEKANVRAAYRFPEKSGAVCVTAGSYLDPKLNSFKRSRLIEAARRRGETEAESIDIKFSDDCDLRHARLWQLTNTEAARPEGATLWGAFEIVSDTAVPFPARICLAGEKTTPSEPNSNWTLSQSASVVTGPSRRCLYRSVQDLKNPRSIIHETPKLVLGEGVQMQPQWQQEISAGKCALAPS